MAMLHEPIVFTIPITPVTKKNHGQIIQVRRGAKKVPVMIPSPQYRKYEADCGKYIPQMAEPIGYPINVQAIYYLPTRRKVDLVNLHGALHDALVVHKVIVDDNSKIIISTDGSRVRYSKNYPRTEIVITEAVDEPYQIDMKMEPDW